MSLIKDRRRSVLYISLTGISEPLGESQVLEYLEGLAKCNSITLFSFERKGNEGQENALKKRMDAADITWHRHYYSNKYGFLSTAFMLFTAQIRLFFISKKMRPQIIHCRSFFPALLGFILVKFSRAKLLFDIRGFAVDEKVDSGRLKKTSLVYRILNKLEKFLYKSSDHIVTLTHASKQILLDIVGGSDKQITVIPTCANSKLFYPPAINEKEQLRIKNNIPLNKKIFIHVGTTVNNYDFFSEVQIFKHLFEKSNTVFFVVISQDPYTSIQNKCENAGLPLGSFLIKKLSLHEIRDWLIMSDYAFFLLNKTFAKIASVPTKFAENIACHLPVITNDGDGDVENYVKSFKVGILIDRFYYKQDMQECAESIFQSCKDFNKSTSDFDKLFNTFFSKERGIEAYDSIYKALCTLEKF